MDVSQSLRAASDSLVRDLDALGKLEEEKRSLPLDDPRLVEIAEQIEVIAARVLAGSAQQTSLAKEAADMPAAASTIDDVRRPLAEILRDWRELERRAEDVPEGSAEAAEIRVLADRLRQEYSDAYAKVRGRT